MAYDVKVKIDLTKPMGKIGFGIPLILSEGAAENNAYKECGDLAEVVDAGYSSSTDVYKTAELIFMQENAPEKIAVCSTTGTASDFLSDSSNTSRDWRHLLVLFSKESTDTISSVAAKVETLESKMFFANVPVDSDDYADTKSLNYSRTVLFYCDSANGYVMPVAALVGETSGREAGSFTYKNLVLKGIQPQNVSNTRINEIHKSGGITFVTKAGDNVTSEGVVTSGEFIDIIDSEDYIIQQLTYQTQKLLNSSAKIPYDNNGIAMLESVAVNVLQTAYNNGMIAEAEDGGADYTVSYGMRDSTSEDDRQARKYVNGSFSFALAGAVHTVEITGEITI